MTSPLAQPLRLPCGATLPNRILKSAMTEGLAGPDGTANQRHCRLYRTWSEGGAGLLITGNLMIDRRYLERPGNVVIDHNGGERELRQWAEAGTANGNHLWMQISHPGRQCARIVSGQPVAPSPVQLKLLGNFAPPRALNAAEIPAIIHRYAEVAKIAREQGFTGVQVHGAHGYLVNQFLSPVTNRRDDEWGGSLENRARFLLETVHAVRSAVGADFPVAVKLNSADFQKGGFSLEESARVAGWLEAEGIDLLEISGGTYEHLKLFDREGRADDAEAPKRESTRRREAYFLDYAQEIRKAVRIPLAVTGGFRSRQAMEESVAAGEIDLVGLARPFCVEPAIARDLVEGRCERAPEWENRLRLGPGPLGPDSRIATFQAINAQGMVAWFYRQIIQLSRNEPLHTDLGLAGALVRHLFDEYRLGFARRRLLGESGTASG